MVYIKIKDSKDLAALENISIGTEAVRVFVPKNFTAGFSFLPSSVKNLGIQGGGTAEYDIFQIYSSRKDRIGRDSVQWVKSDMSRNLAKVFEISSVGMD